MSLGPVMQVTSMLSQICNLMHYENGLNKSEKMPTSLLWFSLLKNDLGVFLDILESLQCALQSVFEMKFEIPLGTKWKMSMKLGQKPA